MRRLSKLRAHEVSLVRRAANRKGFTIFKSAEAPQEQEANRVDSRPMSELLALSENDARRCEAVLGRIVAARESVVAKDEQGVAPLDERAQTALKAVYRILLPFKDQITIDDLDALLDELGIEAGDGDNGDDEDDDVDGVATADETLAKGASPITHEDTMKTDEEAAKAAGGVSWAGDKPDGVDAGKHAKAMKAAKDAYKACFGDKADKAADDDEDDKKSPPWKKTDKAADDDEDDDVAKSVEGGSSKLAAYVRKTEANNRQIVAKAAALEAEIREMRSERVLKTYEDRVRNDFRFLALDPAKTAKVLKGMEDRGGDEAASYMETLKAANEAARVSKSFGTGGVFGTIGASGSSSERAWSDGKAGNEAASKLEAMVEGYVAKSGGASSKYDAWNQVLNSEDGKALYLESISQDRG